MELEYTYFEADDGFFVGWFDDFPEDVTQGKTLDKLEEMLADMYECLNLAKYHKRKLERQGDKGPLGKIDWKNTWRKHTSIVLLIIRGKFMAVSTVNISFQEDLLKQIDIIAQDEARTRSELIREAARLYIERKRKWESIFAYGESLAAQNNLTEEDVMKEIKQYRKEKKEEAAKVQK